MQFLMSNGRFIAVLAVFQLVSVLPLPLSRGRTWLRPALDLAANVGRLCCTTSSDVHSVPGMPETQAI